MKMKSAALLLAPTVSTCALAASITPPAKVERIEDYTKYSFPVGPTSAAPLVIIVPDTTVPRQHITIMNKVAPPAKIAGSLDGAILPLGVKNAQEAMKVWPFATMLEKADMVFIAPETTKLEKSLETSLVIDMSKEVDKIQAELAGSNEKNEKIEIARIVVAKILAPDFEVIEVIKDGRQILDLKGPTEWRWTLTPKKLGEHKVNVTVSAVIEIGNDRAERLIKVFNQEVTVFVTPADAAKYFFSKNWQWLWSTLILPFGIWFWNKKRKKSLISGDDAE